MYVWSAPSGEYRWTRYGCHSYSWSNNKGKCCSLSPFAPEKLVSRDGFGRSVLRQPAHSLHAGRLNLVLSHGSLAAFHECFHIYAANRYGVSPKFIGSRYCMLMSFTAKSPLAIMLCL